MNNWYIFFLWELQRNGKGSSKHLVNVRENLKFHSEFHRYQMDKCGKKTKQNKKTYTSQALKSKSPKRTLIWSWLPWSIVNYPEVWVICRPEWKEEKKVVISASPGGQIWLEISRQCHYPVWEKGHQSSSFLCHLERGSARKLRSAKSQGSVC